MRCRGGDLLAIGHVFEFGFANQLRGALLRSFTFEHHLHERVVCSIRFCMRRANPRASVFRSRRKSARGIKAQFKTGAASVSILGRRFAFGFHFPRPHAPAYARSQRARVEAGGEIEGSGGRVRRERGPYGPWLSLSMSRRNLFFFRSSASIDLRNACSASRFFVHQLGIGKAAHLALVNLYHSRSSSIRLRTARRSSPGAM